MQTAPSDPAATPSGETFWSSLTERKRVSLSLLPSFLVGLLFIWRARGVAPDGSVRWVLFDDAMISMSYARTFAQTGELVWFPGADRVEGITNPLWTLYMALLHAVGLSGNAVVLAVSFTGLVCVLAAGWLAYRIARHLTDVAALWVASAVAVSLTYSLMYWSVRGMEVGAVTVAVLAAVLLAVRFAESVNRRALVGLCVVAAAGVLLRFDFAVVPAVITVWLFFCLRGVRHRLLYCAAPVLVGVAAAGAVVATRILYYGEAFPNTYTLKMTGVTVGDRLARGFDANWKLVGFLLVVAVGVAAITVFRRSLFTNHRAVWLLTGVLAIMVAYSVYVGGDAWEFFPNRYVTPGIATGSIVAIVGVGGLLGRAAGRVGVAAAFAVAVVLFTSSAGGYYQWAATGGLYVYADHSVANWATTLRDGGIADSDTVIAVTTAGASQYYSELPAVDVLGKSDPVVARAHPRKSFLPGHDRWDIAHTILTLKPDIVTNLPFTTEAEWDAIRADYSPYCLDYNGPTETETKEVLVLRGSPHVDVGRLRECEVRRPQVATGWYLKP